MPEVTAEDVRAMMEEVEELDPPDGAFWTMVHERLGLEYGEAFPLIAETDEDDDE